MKKRRTLWWGVSFAVIILVGWVFSISWKQLERNRRIEQEVSLLEAEAEKIRRENETLSEKIGYFSSQDFREQEAKKKLGLRKSEETVVVIKPKPSYGEKETASLIRKERFVSGTGEDADLRPFQKWWNLFFGKK